MPEAGTETVEDIHPKSPIDRLDRGLPEEDRAKSIDVELVAAVLGMSRAFIARALERPGTRPKQITLEQVLGLLDVDGFQETFIPRSKIPSYLLGSIEDSKQPRSAVLDGPEAVAIHRGDARDLLARLAPGSVQCVVTSSPYWGMRVYENTRQVTWADGEQCAYGFEQTPEGFIRHTTEILYLLKPAVAAGGSVWWNLMDTYNTRTPIRGNARERLDEMGSVPESRRGWTAHTACRHSAGHMYLNDAEQSSIPPRVAERASRIGYRLKSYITWRKSSATPEPVQSRGTRQAEYILHLSVGDTPPTFNKDQWTELEPELGGPHPTLESAERLTDVWSLPTSSGKNGHGAEFPLALPGRCIALASSEGDLVLDPFIGSGTTALAAVQLGRRCIGFDISDHYVELAQARVAMQQGLEELTAKEVAALAAQLHLETDDEGTLATAIVTSSDTVAIPVSRRGGASRPRPHELAPAAPPYR
jgi:DNA modification methylase